MKDQAPRRTAHSAQQAPRKHRSATAWLTLCTLFLLSAAPTPSFGAEATPSLPSWAFERDGDLQGWQPNGHLTNLTVKAGVLHCQAIGSDPILVLQPLINFPATPWQYLQVRLRANHEGIAEFFWSNTTQGQYGGFGQEKSTRFPVLGDNQWHVYRIFPCWQTEGKIVRLRFDLYDAAMFDVDSIEVATLNPGAPATVPEFDFIHAGLSGWQGMLGAQATKAAEGPLRATMGAADSMLIAPPVNIDASDNTYVSLRMSVDKGRRGTVWFATDKTPGMQTLSFPIKPGAAMQTYNLDMLGATGWRGRVVALGLKPSDAEGATANLEWCRVSGQPQGEGQPVILSWSVVTVPPRAGIPTTLEATLSNQGGEPLTNLVARLVLPPGVRLAKAGPLAQTIPKLDLEATATVRWEVIAEKPLQGAANIVLAPSSGPEITAQLDLRFTPRIESDHTGYVPVPKPVHGPYEVGAYYFPGWKSASQWHPIERFPERRPLLGWYREGEPEIADWHIKWAVEHGITFFAYDWYWSQGTRQLEHGLHDGFFKARYRNLLKFCLLWANHNAPKTSSKEDCVAVTRFWIENYFRRPEHLLVDGKPLMIIFSPYRFTEDMGSAGVKDALSAMRAECVKAGLKGLYLTACVGDTGAARQALAEGYDAVTAYNWPHLGLAGEGMYAPFEPLVPAYRRQWENILANAGIPLVPLPICGGWDSRPWHGDNNLVRYGRTPELFRKHMQDARDVLDHGFPPSGNTPKLALVEAWNEWGEGSYIEPHAQYGFGFLDAIRDTFTDAPKEHADPTPIDLGLGPYEVAPEPPARTSWSFAKDTDGWNNTMDMTDVSVTNGVLQARSTGNDPAFFSSPIQAQARDLGTLVFRMRLSSKDGAAFKDAGQVFWRTSRLSESEASSLRFEVPGDGNWHEYRLALSQNKRWRGLITRLRLDPCNRNGVNIEVTDLRLLP